MRKKASFDVDSREDEQHVVPGKVEKGGGFAASGSVACGELSARVAKAADWLEGRMRSLCHRLQPSGNALAIDLARPIISL